MAQGAGGLMVSVSGIRGRVGEALTPEVVARYAAAFGAWALAQGGSRRVVVGRDSRVSGPMFHRIVVGALQSVGCDVIDIGLTTTPDLPARRRAPPRRRRADAVGQPQSDRVERAQVHRAERALSRGERRAPRCGRSSRQGFRAPRGIDLGAVDAGRPDAAARHLDAVLAIPYLDVEAIRAARVPGRARLRVAARAPRSCRRCWSALGCEVVAINTRAGRALSARAGARRREPRRARASRAGDAGRTSGSRSIPTWTGWRSSPTKGEAIGEDYTLALAARLVLRHRRGPVVTNLSTQPDRGGRGGERRECR